MQARTPLARRHQIAFVLVAAAALTAAVVGVARAARTVRPNAARPSVASLRLVVGHYRQVTWTFERAAHVGRAHSSFLDRRTTNRAYLRWAIDRWTRRAYVARRQALNVLRQRLDIHLPKAPGLRAPLYARLSYSRRLVLALRRVYPGRASGRMVASARSAHGRGSAARLLRLWQARSATAALLVSEHARRRAQIPASLREAFTCIHHYEASWTANTGNGYYGGLQMDMPFQSRYGAAYLGRYGTADHWPVWAQLEVAVRAYRAGRGFWPWPNTARACGLL